MTTEDVAIAMTTEDVARRLSMPPSTVRQMLVNGDLCAYYRVGRAIRVDPGDLEAWIKERKAACEADARATGVMWLD